VTFDVALSAGTARRRDMKTIRFFMAVLLSRFSETQSLAIV
jgi:hypothetical protein